MADKNKIAKKENARDLIHTFVAGILYAAVLIMILLPFGPNSIFAETYNDNTTVLTKLNISNAAPIVTNVIMYDDDSADLTGDIILNQGTYDIVWCNATVNDSNGWTDIIKANGTLFHNGNFTSPNDNNVRYQNSSCSLMQNGGASQSAIASCTFKVMFYANNGTWNCSITVEDNASVTDSETTDNESVRDIAALYAMGFDSLTIDYGVLNVTGISDTIPFNITNFGNRDIKISVEGYGSSLHDGLAMNCSSSTSISVNYEKYSVQQNANWSINMTPLTSDPLLTGIENLTIVQNQDDSGNSTNTTYWAIKAPIGVQTGPCNGTILFSAVPAN